MIQRIKLQFEIEKPKLVLLIAFSLLLLFPLTSAISLEELLSSYSFDFFNNEIDIASVSDSMQDTDLDSVDDTLVFDIQINDANTGGYVFNIELEDNNTNINSFPTSVSINFDTFPLTQNMFNYTLRIYEMSNDELIYRQINY